MALDQRIPAPGYIVCVKCDHLWVTYYTSPTLLCERCKTNPLCWACPSDTLICPGSCEHQREPGTSPLTLWDHVR